MDIELLKRDSKGLPVPLAEGDKIPEKYLNLSNSMNGFSRITVSNDAPKNPHVNDLWIDTNP